MISALRKSTSLVRPRVLSSFATKEWTRSFQTTPKVEAESMGNLIDKGKEGAEFVVSGTFNILYPLSLFQFQTESHLFSKIQRVYLKKYCLFICRYRTICYFCPEIKLIMFFDSKPLFLTTIKN